MTTIKLSEWADKHGLSYLTANRYFHAGMIPGAYRTESGAIRVENNSLEDNMNNNISSDAVALFIKKTVEFSKNNSSVEDFAAYVISNFQLKISNTSNEISSPKARKIKSPEEQSNEIQEGYLSRLPSQTEMIRLKNIKTKLKEGKLANDEGYIIVPANLSETFNTIMKSFDVDDKSESLTAPPLRSIYDVAKKQESTPEINNEDLDPLNVVNENDEIPRVVLNMASKAKKNNSDRYESLKAAVDLSESAITSKKDLTSVSEVIETDEGETNDT